MIKNRFFNIDGDCLLVEADTGKAMWWQLLRRGGWIDGKNAALDYLWRGEHGAHEITRPEAEALAIKLGSALSQGTEALAIKLGSSQ